MEYSKPEEHPLVDLVEHLGVEGVLEMAPLSPVGWGAPVELIGLGVSPNFAAPINCCWLGHTCHWCNRQH